MENVVIAIYRVRPIQILKRELSRRLVFQLRDIMILFIQTLALYKSFYLLTYLLIINTVSWLKWGRWSINHLALVLALNLQIYHAISVGAQSTLGARHFCPKIYIHEKLTKCSNFTWFLPEKYFCRILGRGGASAHLPTSSTLLRHVPRWLLGLIIPKFQIAKAQFMLPRRLRTH